MAKTTSGITFASLMQQLQLRQYAPIYLLMGDESYYIDKVVEFMENNILNEADREFNQIIHYANDKTEANVDLVSAVINEARRYPMMGDKQVIYLRECQSLDKKNLFDKLALYLENPQPTSIVVLTYKHGSADRRKKWVQAVEKVGVVFESKKLYENEVSVFIADAAKKNNLKITADASRLLLELVGASGSLRYTADAGISHNDLNRLAVGVEQVLLEQLLCGLSHCPYQGFQRFTHHLGAAAAINDGANANYRIISNVTVFHIYSSKVLCVAVLQRFYI